MRIEHWLYTLPLRVRSLFRRRQVEQELDEELQFHLERKAEEYIAQGLTPEKARQAALRSMQGLTQRKEECRDTWHVNAIENTLRDIRYGLRVLSKSPGFTMVAVATLALAIGANAVVFALLNSLILRPLNVPDAQSLYGTEYGTDVGFQSYPNYIDLRDRNHSFDGLAAFKFAFVGLDTGNDPSLSTGYAVTGNYFDVLRIQPYLGHFFHRSDEHGPNSAPYVVLSYACWHRHFQDDRAIVGHVLRINKHPFTMVGVAPPGFRGTILFASPDFFMPIVNQQQVEGENLLDARGNDQGIFEAFGHLKAGVTPAAAAADLKSVGSYLEKTYPKEFGQKSYSVKRITGLTSFFGAARAFITALSLLAGLILLAACANLGVLFAARAADRSREVALRLALGSSRNRILRQLLTEATLIAIAGGAVGLWGSILLLHRLSGWEPFAGAPIHVPVSPDTSTYVVALVLAFLSGLLFGIVPVRQVLRTDPYQIVKSGSRTAGTRRMTMRELLLAIQIAICAVLVTSSVVAVRGLMRSLHGNFGFEPKNVMLAGTNLTMAGYSGAQVPAMQKRMIAAVQSIPGVEHVGLVNKYPPLVYTAAFRTSVFNDRTADLRSSNAAIRPFEYEISPQYFAAASTNLLAGRDFTWHDDKNTQAVAIVNLEFAARIFGAGKDAVGQYFKLQDGTRVQIVGLVEDGKYLNLTEDTQPAIFLPFLQSPASDSSLLVRSHTDSQQLITAIRGKLRDLDAGLPVDTETWIGKMDVVMFPARVATLSLGVLGLIGAMLSITGVFGMAAYSVSRRLKELGIRLALGAQRKEVLQAALGRALKLLAFGSAAGLILGILASQVLSAIVYQATSRDPLVWVAVILAMSLLGLLATWIPAQRALSLDPLTLLREE